ncbi:patatin-like phospholipase family protein [Microvirga sp. ACRRW]|uniref:patatin-like phospholipase family protein n=1 Tax=Microvirga sp. ACRRW TaxID=2918205 RepID=UPI001EF415C3|nr:patatin-like phospholipase family protein [Microvirga sp. ACRRW]MCG7392432.1 patatin-like phospholipase family protein [Microvirga sp. ACRRW]
MFDAVAFAGGGNRCYWQGGFWEAASPLLNLKPSMVVGVSAGAWSACYSLLGLGRTVNAMVAEGCSQGRRNFEWKAWRSEGSPWPVAFMYRSLIETIIDDDALAYLQQGPDVLIGLARKPRRLPLSIAVPLGIATYQIEKKWHSPVHPRGGRALGFSPEFVRVQDLETPAEVSAALMASASVPPFMPVGLVGGMAALDGGLVDNVPTEPLLPVEAQGGKTLVILSRLYRAFPNVKGRTYIQPSAPVPIGQFDITNPSGIRKAYEMGLRDGEAFAKRAASHI